MPQQDYNRSCSLLPESVLRITETIRGKITRTFYRLEKNPNAPGAWRLHKLVHSDEEPALYDVLLAGEGSSCDCLGFLSHNHCKHVESLSTLVEAGKLS